MRIRLIPALAVSILLPCLVALGFWQLGRAQYKRELIAEYERRSSDAPIGLSALGAEAESLRFRRAQTRGAYDVEHQVLLDNRTHNGRAGFHVLTPLRLEHGGAVLVNRGWVGLGATRQDLPDVTVAPGPQSVTGLLDLPPPSGLRLGPDEQTWGSWPVIVQRVDIAAIERGLGYGLMPVVLLLDPDPAQPLVRDWQVSMIGPQRHIGYAVQWFGLAAALVLLLAFARRGSRRGGPGN